MESTRPTSDAIDIALTFDADSDTFDASLTKADEDPRLLRWRGIEAAGDRLVDVLDGYRDYTGRKARATWFVRVDSQIETICGDATFLLSRFASLWSRCRARGDEMGLHPHLYRLEDGRWRQEIEEERLRAELRSSYAAMVEAGYFPRSSRIGEAYCTNGVMATLDELGLWCDSTAMPGRRRQDSGRHLDWSETPERPYHPDRRDYRRPGPLPLRILEVPMSMVPVRADYDLRPLRRYVDLSFRHSALRDGLAELLQTASHLVTITHPSTLLPELAPKGGHGLLSFQFEEIRRNLDFVLEESSRLGRAVRFVTISEFCGERAS